jgi:hypothetical protein
MSQFSLRDSLPLTLFSTVDMQSDRGDLLRRMLESVVAFQARRSVDVKLFILLQRCDEDGFDNFKKQWPDWVKPLKQSGRMSLSAARNAMLANIEATERLQSDGVVAFPDDDAWYPDGTLDRIVDDFTADKTLDFWFSRYGMQAVSALNYEAVSPSLQKVISLASSNTIVVRSNLASQIGGFDLDLGVGAILSGGEDTDYAIRAYKAARKTLFIDAKCVGHRDPQPALKAKYYPGSLRAIAKNTTFHLTEIIALSRKLLVGGFLSLRGRMALRDYVAAITSSFAR